MKNLKKHKFECNSLAHKKKTLKKKPSQTFQDTTGKPRNLRRHIIKSKTIALKRKSLVIISRYKHNIHEFEYKFNLFV